MRWIVTSDERTLRVAFFGVATAKRIYAMNAATRALNEDLVGLVICRCEFANRLCGLFADASHLRELLSLRAKNGFNGAEMFQQGASSSWPYRGNCGEYIFLLLLKRL